jgi:isocitrate dehydrogenase
MYHQIVPPSQGEKIQVLANGQWIIPNEPIIAFIEGDGVNAFNAPTN